MKVLVVSDEESDFLYGPALQTHFADVDVLLSCGDLPYPYLEYLVTLLNVPFLYVRGNHDDRYRLNDDVVLTAPRGGQNANGRVLPVCNGKGEQLLVGGLEGTMCYGDHKHHYCSEAQMARRVWRMAPQLLWNRWRCGHALDVLVTHAPPYGVHDGQDPCHRGYRAFRNLIERFEPRYLIHGHTHPTSGYDGQTCTLGKTTIVNVYGYKVLEIEGHARE